MQDGLLKKRAVSVALLLAILGLGWFVRVEFTTTINWRQIDDQLELLSNELPARIEGFPFTFLEAARDRQLITYTFQFDPESESSISTALWDELTASYIKSFCETSYLQPHRDNDVRIARVFFDSEEKLVREISIGLDQCS